MIRRKVQNIILWLGCMLMLCSPAFPGFAKTVGATPPDEGAHVLIDEIKLGGDADHDPSGLNGSNEWITLFNATQDSINLKNWKLEYAKDGSNVSCQASSWNGATAVVTKVLPETTLDSHALTGGIAYELTDTKDGSLRLVDSNGTVQDLVGWGENAPCSESTSAARPPKSQSIERKLSCADSFPVDDGNNESDFTVSTAPNPDELSSQYAQDCSQQSSSPNDTACSGIIINELLPNPSGADMGHEFIELYNPTDAAIPLNGCALQTSGSTTKIFHFAATDVLEPGEYRTWDDTATGLTLPNSAGGTVWLLSPEQEELQQVDYPAGLDDDVAWALFGNSWQQTYAPTPNAENSLLAELPCPAGQERNPDTGRCRNIVTTASMLVPCKPGQVRNPETHRCHSSSSTTSSSLKPCKPGQYRNPQTNRCHSLVSSENGLKACKAGQVRNPATNRCKSASSSGNSLKPCKAGWARNPDTHRCRKSSDVKGDAINKVHDVASPIAHNAVGWLIAALAALSIIGYAAYEWRQEIRTYLTKFKTTGIHLRRNKR